VTSAPPARTVGVEEEYQLLRPASRTPAGDPDRVPAPEEGVDAELKLSMREVQTSPVTRLEDVRRELAARRRQAREQAEAAGLMVVAAGTVPLADWQRVPLTPEQRYADIERHAAQLAREQLVCGCHVHVGVEERDLAVAVADRARPWLPLLLALSASSPYWDDRDTGYASYRATVWDRWPVAGIPPVTGDAAGYDELADALLATGAILDRKQLYWDIRPSEGQPTVEFRVADVCTRLDDAVLQVALCRALALTAEGEADAGVPPLDVPDAVIRAAKWRAARYGVDGALVDIEAGGTAPARDVLDRFLTRLRPALEATGDREEAEEHVARILRDGSSADLQRRAFETAGRLEDVVDVLVRTTAGED
jgi:carboxylate-amine ligase